MAFSDKTFKTPPRLSGGRNAATICLRLASAHRETAITCNTRNDVLYSSSCKALLLSDGAACPEWEVMLRRAPRYS